MGSAHPTGMLSCVFNDFAIFLHCFTITVQEMGKDLMIHFFISKAVLEGFFLCNGEWPGKRFCR